MQNIRFRAYEHVYYACVRYTLINNIQILLLEILAVTRQNHFTCCKLVKHLTLISVQQASFFFTSGKMLKKLCIKKSEFHTVMK